MDESTFVARQVTRVFRLSRGGKSALLDLLGRIDTPSSMRSRVLSTEVATASPIGSATLRTSFRGD